VFFGFASIKKLIKDYCLVFFQIEFKIKIFFENRNQLFTEFPKGRVGRVERVFLQKFQRGGKGKNFE
jgi:hypothetical protein